MARATCARANESASRRRWLRVLEFLYRRQQDVMDVRHFGRGLLPLVSASHRAIASPVRAFFVADPGLAAMEALSTAGIPVYARPGRGAGWQLLGDGRTDLSGLSAAEARALFLIAGPQARLAPDAKSALRKLVRSLPAPFREHAMAAAEAIVLDRQAGVPPRRPRLPTLTSSSARLLRACSSSSSTAVALVP